MHRECSVFAIEQRRSDVGGQIADQRTEVLPQENGFPADLRAQILEVEHLALLQRQRVQLHVVGQHLRLWNGERMMVSMAFVL